MKRTKQLLLTIVILLALSLAGCTEHGPTITNMPNNSNSISILPLPEYLNAPWILSRPSLIDTSGLGNAELENVQTGNYSISWGEVGEWTSPISETITLTSGGAISFSGVYVEGNPFSLAKVGTDSTLEVMTWNLEQFAKNDSITIELVIQAVQALDVDIIALQEIRSEFHFQAVVDGLEGWSGFKANSAPSNINLAFLYRTDGPLQMESIQELMTDLWGPFPRSPLLFQGSFDGTPIAVINNHLKCCGDGYIDENDAYDEETRRRDACVLLEDYVLENIADRGVFIVGDFNDELTDAIANNVFENFLGSPEDWRFSDLGIAQGPSSGWSFPGLPSHLDHILVNNLLFDEVTGSASETTVIPLDSYFPGGWYEYDRNISDHLPVVLKTGPFSH